MTKVKICGLMSLDDVQAVNKYKPDYAGFIFAPSRRRLTTQLAKKLCGALDKDILRVGVFVNEEAEVMMQAKRQCGLDILQIYQDEEKTYSSLSGGIWRVVRIKDESSLAALDSIKADAYVLDTYSKTAFGGTGETFNWDLAQKAAQSDKIVLAGGLSPENVQQAVRKTKPFAVDVSSGVETNGIKDIEKIKDFIENARRS